MRGGWGWVSSQLGPVLSEGWLGRPQYIARPTQCHRTRPGAGRGSWEWEWELEVGGWRLEVGGWKVEGGRWKLEVVSLHLTAGTDWVFDRVLCDTHHSEPHSSSTPCPLVGHWPITRLKFIYHMRA